MYANLCTYVSIYIFVSTYQPVNLSIETAYIYLSINPILIWIFILSSINPIYHLSEASFYHFNMKYHTSVFFILVYLSMYHLSEAPFSSGLPLPRVTCAPGFVDTNLTLEHKTTKVESVRKKNLQKNVPLTKFVPTKVSGFYNLCYFLCFFFEIALNFHNTFVGPCSHVGW